MDAIVNAVEARRAPVVLALHSATGFSGYAASDVVPDRIAAVVYVDTAPGKGRSIPSSRASRSPSIGRRSRRGRTSTGSVEPQLATFRERAVPSRPASLPRRPRRSRTTPARDIPSTIIATGYTSEDYQKYAREHPEWAFLAGIPELRNVTWIDLPTSHWPMWSRPAETRGDHRRRRDEGRGCPMTASLLDDVFAHHVWATERLIDECAALTPEQLAAPAAGTYGSIIDTFRHLVSSDGWYLSFLREQPAPIDEEADVALAEITVGDHDERRGVERAARGRSRR